MVHPLRYKRRFLPPFSCLLLSLTLLSVYSRHIHLRSPRVTSSLPLQTRGKVAVQRSKRASQYLVHRTRDNREIKSLRGSLRASAAKLTETSVQGQNDTIKFAGRNTFKQPTDNNGNRVVKSVVTAKSVKTIRDGDAAGSGNLYEPHIVHMDDDSRVDGVIEHRVTRKKGFHQNEQMRRQFNDDTYLARILLTDWARKTDVASMRASAKYLVRTLKALGVDTVRGEEPQRKSHTETLRRSSREDIKYIYSMAKKAKTAHDVRKVKDRVDHALDVIKKRGGRNYELLDVHNLYLKASAKALRPDLVEQGLRDLRWEGLPPNEESYLHVIEACAKALPSLERAAYWMDHMREIDMLIPTEKHYNVFLRACAEKADFGAAGEWLDTMLRDGLNPGADAFHIILNACAVRGNVEEAQYWIEVMKKLAIKMEYTTFYILFMTCVNAKDIERAEHWLHAWAKSGLRPHRRSYNTMIHLLHFLSKRAEYWMKEMQANKVTPDTKSFDEVITASVKSQRMNRAEYWLGRMSSFGRGVKPHLGTFEILLREYSLMESFADIDRILKMLLDRGIKPNTLIFSHLMRACARSSKKGMLNKAEEYIHKMLDAGVDMGGGGDVYGDVAELCVTKNRLDRLEHLSDMMLQAGIVPTAKANARITQLLKKHTIKKKLMPEGYFFD
mmetsp:Transcript_11051/g.21166  ORF Transcript_11051/g.21166 Transcript_11051/m.21166 type:complete len:670 (-) Transcript_11051:202-2211(-)